MCSRVDPVKGNLKAPQNSTVLRFWCTLIGSGFVSLTDFPHLKEYDHYTNLSVPAAISPVRNVPLGMNIHWAGEGKIVWCSNRITQWEYGTLTSKSLFKWVFNYLYVLEFFKQGKFRAVFIISCSLELRLLTEDGEILFKASFKFQFIAPQKLIPAFFYFSVLTPGSNIFICSDLSIFCCFEKHLMNLFWFIWAIRNGLNIVMLFQPKLKKQMELEDKRKQGKLLGPIFGGFFN